MPLYFPPEVTLTNTATLTNKTLTAPAISAATFTGANTGTIGASAAANTTLFSETADNTQTNSVFLNTRDVGTSGKAVGLLVKGTGSTATTAADKHLILWGNTAANANKVLSVGNATTFAENLFITANGIISGDSAFGLRLTGLSSSLTLDNSVGAKLALVNSSLSVVGAGVRGVQGAQSSGSATGFSFTGGAHTTLAASTEALGIDFDLSQTVQFSTGALTTQRAFVVKAPTYGFVGASTLTNAATFAVTAPPTAGTNATLTNRFAIWAQTGPIALGNGIEPANNIADISQIYGVDLSAGNCSLGFRTEHAVAADVSLASTHSIQIRWNGSTYKIPLTFVA